MTIDTATRHRRIRTGALFGILLAEILCVARAATPLPPTPAQGWCYVTLTTAGYQDVNACANTPPTPVDPGAYTTQVITWIVKPQTIPASTDVTQFFNIFGHIKPALPVQGWPGAGGTTVTMPDNSAKYYRLRLTMPMNPGTQYHMLTAPSYGKSPANLRANFAVVAAGQPWPTGADTACYKTNVAFQDQPVITLNPGPPNSTRCPVSPGAAYDLLIDTIGNGVAAAAWN